MDAFLASWYSFFRILAFRVDIPDSKGVQELRVELALDERRRASADGFPRGHRIVVDWPGAPDEIMLWIVGVELFFHCRRLRLISCVFLGR